jgi:hypothetical protein
MTYWDHPGNVSSFETCVGRIFEAAGQPNPYKSPGALVQRGGRQVARSNLTVPYTELLYPLVDP